MTKTTHKRDRLGRWVVPQITFTFRCKQCRQTETRTRHPCGAKPKLCKPCSYKRKAVYDKCYYHTTVKVTHAPH